MKRLETEFLDNSNALFQELLNSEVQNTSFLRNKRKELLVKWSGFSDIYLELENFEKMMYIGQDILVFSLFKDKEVLDLMEKLGIGKIVTKFFINLETLLDSVQEFIRQSKFNWDPLVIMMFYYLYSQTFFFKQLSVDLKLDFDATLRSLQRREKKDKLSQ